MTRAEGGVGAVQGAATGRRERGEIAADHARPQRAQAATVSRSLNGARLGADDLVILVALAGDDDDVAGFRLGDRVADRLGPIRR